MVSGEMCEHYSLSQSIVDDNSRRQDLRMLAPKMNADTLARALEQFVNDELLLKDIEVRWMG